VERTSSLFPGGCRTDGFVRRRLKVLAVTVDPLQEVSSEATALVETSEASGLMSKDRMDPCVAM